MGEEVHRLHAVVGQEGGGVGPFDHFCCVFEGPFGVAVFAQQGRGFRSGGGHSGLVFGAAFQLAGDAYLLYATSPGLSFFHHIAGRLPFDAQGFFGVHDLPSRIAHHHDHFREGKDIEHLPFVVILERFDGKHIADTRHGFCGGVVHGFQFHAERRGVCDHRDEHSVAAEVHSEQRLAGHDFQAVHIFAGGADELEVFRVFQLYLGRHG